ncbi:MAG: hypothetical protein JSW72_02715 [Candidatus Bathyarchaeota archaeon]|nr:MAG: hypothetical protein JSW72_02715 [Candidatus Bathyarchaeota archaeon]
MAKSGREKEKGAVDELERMCYETKVFKNGKEVFASEELRQKLFGIISFLPLRKVIDRGYTLDDRKRLNPREAAAVSMLDNRILTDKEFQKEVKDLLLKRARLEENFPVGELEKDERASYALFFLAHKWVTNYIPRNEKDSIFDRADKGQIDLEEEIYGKKRAPKQGNK